MSLGKMDLEELITDLVEISTLVDEAQESQSVHAPPLICERGKAQLPILRRVEELLGEELHDRLGYGELAEVAIDAMEEHIIDQRVGAVAVEGLARGRFLEQTKQLRQGREALGWTPEVIREHEAKELAQFEEEHPDVMAGCVYNREMLYTAREQIDKELAKQARERVLDETINEERDWTPSQPAIHLRADIHAEAVNENRHRYTKQALISDGSDSILQAMRDAAGDSLDHLATEVLLEYLKLWRKKHHDYGPENHAIWGPQGCVIRATDKLMRLKQRYFGYRKMKNEVIEDTWLDLIGYGLIGLIIERGQWPRQTLLDVAKAMRVAKSQEPLPCPHCGSEQTSLWVTAYAQADKDYLHCGLECEDCDGEIRATMAPNGSITALREAVQNAIKDREEQHAAQVDN